MVHMINTIKHKVVKCLEKYEQARNSDKILIGVIAWEYYSHLIDRKKRIYLKDLHKLPSYETITRCRRLIQNTEKKLLPTSKSVLEKRGLLEEEHREYFKQV